MSRLRLVRLVAAVLVALLILALLAAGWWLAIIFVIVLLAAWPISERWAREYRQGLDGAPDKPWPSPFEKHDP
jgi:hypothetical protein